MAGQKLTQQIPGVSILGVRPDGQTRNGSPIFKVQTSDGQERSTFDQQAANKAMGLVGQAGTLVISINGQYQNFEDFIPGNGAAPMGQAFPQQAAVGQVYGAVVPPVMTPAPGFVDAKEARIIRGNALNAAAATVGAFVGSGFFVNEEGVLQTDDIVGFTLKVARGFAEYLKEQPAQAQVAESVPALPPGVSAEQIAAWLASQGAQVAVGTAAVQQDAAAEAPDAERVPY